MCLDVFSTPMSSFSMVILGDETIASKFRRGIMIHPSFFSRGDQVAGLRNHRETLTTSESRGIFMEIFMGYLWEYLGIFTGISGDIHGKMSEFM